MFVQLIWNIIFIPNIIIIKLLEVLQFGIALQSNFRQHMIDLEIKLIIKSQIIKIIKYLLTRKFL